MTVLLFVILKPPSHVQIRLDTAYLLSFEYKNKSYTFLAHKRTWTCKPPLLLVYYQRKHTSFSYQNLLSNIWISHDRGEAGQPKSNTHSELGCGQTLRNLNHPSWEQLAGIHCHFYKIGESVSLAIVISWVSVHERELACSIGCQFHREMRESWLALLGVSSTEKYASGL